MRPGVPQGKPGETGRKATFKCALVRQSHPLRGHPLLLFMDWNCYGVSVDYYYTHFKLSSVVNRPNFHAKVMDS